MRKRFPNAFIIPGLVLSIAGFVLFLPLLIGGDRAFAQCVPAQAYFSGVADDSLTIWVNGNQLNTASEPITYLDVNSPIAPYLYTFPVSYLNTSGPNTICFENINVQASIVLCAWWIDIVCADGDNDYLTSDDGGYSMYDDTTGGNPPPTYSGLQWYQPGWSDATNLFTGSPALVNLNAGYTAKNLWNPATGQVMNPISWQSSAQNHTASEVLYYRKVFTLSETPPNPPNFVITKTASDPSGLAWNQTVNYSLKICNTGGPVPGPVTIIDTHDSHLSVAVNPSSSTYPGSFPFTYQNGAAGLTMVYESGFGGNGTCDTVTYGMYAGYYPANCQVMDNSVTLKTLSDIGAPVSASASYAVTMACATTPTNTQTYTNTTTPHPTSTSTATSTVTNSHTPTVASTYTDTFTSTYTPTVTNSQTLTFTETVTNSPTDTPSPTVTNTNTETPVNTYTNTFTSTYTPTVTNSQTNTETLLDTATNTFTATVTNSQTYTSTNTVTNTNTPSATVTNSYTPVPSATATNTYTVSPTNTTSYTPTMTSTLAPNTATNTMSPTNTQSSTATPPSSVSIVKIASETVAKSGDDVTYTIGVTVAGNSIFGGAVTDAFPANMTFVGVVSTPTGATGNPTSTGVQWNLPSPASPGTYMFVYTLQVNNFAPAGQLLNNAKIMYTGGQETAQAPVTVVGNFTVSVNIYNSAGEVVKTIPTKQFSTAITNITLSTTNTITTLQGSGSTIDILYDGFIIGIWDGTNNENQPVGNGTYKVQIDNASNSGTVTSVSQNAIVNRSLSNVEVDIFNAAGEVVKKLYEVISNGGTYSMTNVALSASEIRPSAANNNSNSASVSVYVVDTNAPVTLVWDGTNNSGAYVSPGQYEVQVHWTDGNGDTTNITKSLLVLPTSVSGKVIAKPNVLDAKNNLTTNIDASGIAGASSQKVSIYTITGELVKPTLTGPPQYTTWTPSALGLASGIYIAVVDVNGPDGGLLVRQTVKILYMH